MDFYGEYKSCTTDDILKKYIAACDKNAMKGLLFDVFYYLKDYNLAKEFIVEVKSKGIYPYKNSRLSFKKNNNKKQFYINLF